MRQYIRFGMVLGLSLTLVADLSAQSNEPAPGIGSLQSAWFGGVGVGVGAHDNGPFSNRLQSWSPVGADNMERVYRTGAVSGTGYTLNGGGAVLFSEKFLIGASGERLLFPSFEAVTTDEKRASYSLSGGGGGLDFGYAVVNDGGTIIWPYLTAGYYGYSLTFDNTLDVATPFFEGEPVAAGASETYTGASFRGGLGVGLTRFIGGTSSGPVLQVRLNYGRYLSHPTWEVDGTEVFNGGKTPCYNALQLSVMIGGGMGSL